LAPERLKIKKCSKYRKISQKNYQTHPKPDQAERKNSESGKPAAARLRTTKKEKRSAPNKKEKRATNNQKRKEKRAKQKRKSVPSSHCYELPAFFKNETASRHSAAQKAREMKELRKRRA